MKKRLLFILSVVVFLLPSTKSMAQESMMNDIDYPFLQKLINNAKQNYTAVKVRQEQVNIAKTTYKESKYSWFDAVSFSYIYNPNNAISYSSNNAVAAGAGTAATGNTVNPNLTFGYQAAVTLNLGTLIKNPFNTKIAKANYNIALLEQQGADVALETQVRRLYLTYVQLQASVRMRYQNAQDVYTMVTQAKHKFEQNLITVDVYSTAVTALATANQNKIDAEAGVLLVKGQLEEIVGKKLEEIK